MATAALLLYGGWAFAANWSHGFGPASKAAATQGFVSFTIAFVVTSLMEWLSRTTDALWGKFARAAGGAIMLTTTYTIGMHWWMGTPEILNTVAPVIVLGGLYCILYSANLVREARKLPPTS